MTTTGVFDKNEAKTHFDCPSLAENIAKLLNPKLPVIDFGCGNGYYLNYLETKGFEELIAVDGNPTYGKFLFLTRDLSKPLDLGVKGNVISLEVGEHIPAEYEETFLNTITKHVEDTLILSWAVEGQPGIGHVNCRNNDYIIEQIEKRGLKYNEEQSLLFRAGVCEHTPWFNNTLMIFNK